MKKLLTTLLLLGIGACASQPRDLPTTYVSPYKYKDYDCDQIVMEMNHVSRRTTQLHGSLKKTADNDAAQMGVGMIFLWPMLFALEGGDGPEATEYSNLKGEFNSLQTAVVQKKCDMDLLPPSPENTLIQTAQKAEEQASKLDQEMGN